jgi:hypothetical protein
MEKMIKNLDSKGYLDLNQYLIIPTFFEQNYNGFLFFEDKLRN